MTDKMQHRDGQAAEDGSMIRFLSESKKLGMQKGDDGRISTRQGRVVFVGWKYTRLEYKETMGQLQGKSSKSEQ